MLRKIFSLTTGAVIAAGVLVAPTVAAQDVQPEPQPVVRDGSSPEQSAASCWAIKQEFPTKPNGAYWIQSPDMHAPEQFFCNQEMDGGGWVMIGKGREGWDQFPDGKGDPTQMLSGDRSPANFDTVQLPEKLIEQLTMGEEMRNSQDGFRVTRATNARGTGWQNFDIRPTRMREFSWALPTQDTSTYRINNGSWRSGTRMDRSFGSGLLNDAMDLTTGSNRQWKMGFAFGSWKTGGSTSSDSFLWGTSTWGPIPFAEVYVRPRIANNDASFARIADEGTDAIEQRAMASNFASPMTWGVTGNLNGRTAEGNAPVQTFAEIGDTVFVGGNFTHAEQRSTGTRVERTGVAAFDKTTGDLKQEFQINLNGQVKSLLAMPNGKLLIGGEFTTANSQRHVGTVLVDPVTGEIDPSWTLQFTNKISGGSVSVRSMQLTDDHVYFGGAFTHLKSEDSREIYARSAGRAAHDGHPDITWNPEFNGNVMDVDTSPEGDRFYAAGYFTQTKGQRAIKGAVLTTAEGAAQINAGWNPSPSYWREQETYQQTVSDTGKLVFFGGAQHNFFGYDRNSLQRMSASITKLNGGDFQASATDGSVVYGGCHCDDHAFQDATQFLNTNMDVNDQWTHADKIQWFGAWDAETGEQLDEFTPYMLSSFNAGAWGLFVASDGAVWAGGDFTGSRTDMNTNQWNSGFVRYPSRDSEAPATPDRLNAGVTQQGIMLNWAPVEDAAGYEILRDDRVIATTTTPNYTATPAGENRYFVRAVDAAGNRSASTAVVAINPEDVEDAPASADVITFGEVWNYSYGQGVPEANWNTNDGDYSAWTAARTPIGYGSREQLQTTLVPAPASQRPVTTWFTKRVNIDNPESFTELTLNYIADDGSVVYVNGREVSRTRMDEGTITPDTRATASITAEQAKAQPASVTIPSHMLQAGENTIAVETHLNYLSSPSMTFDAELFISNFDPAPEYIPEPEPVTAIDNAAEWSYRFNLEAPADNWNQPDANNDADSGWETGTGPIGWGAQDVVTAIEAAPADRPLATYFTHDIDINKADFEQDYASLRLNVRADDGVVVYVNGQEVGRKRMADGEVTHTTYASENASASYALVDPYVIDIPLAALNDGTNRIAVQTHINYRSAPSMVFATTAELFPTQDLSDEEKQNLELLLEQLTTPQDEEPEAPAEEGDVAPQEEQALEEEAQEQPVELVDEEVGV